MNDSAAIVVVGAGIVGASVAYHLAQLGHTDILVLDRGDIPHNPGSTSHAPGGVVAMSHNRLLARMSFYSTDLYRRLAPYEDLRHTYNPVGSIEVARTPERMADLVREQGESLAFGSETSLLDPSQIADKVPYLDRARMAGGLFIPDSAIVSGVNLTGSLLRDAQATGAVRLRRHTRIARVETDNDRLAALLTHGGERIEAEQMVLCTNIWPLPSGDGLLPLPLLAFEHQYVETTDVLHGFDPSNPDDEVTVPTVRDMDVGLYYRHHWNRVGVGSYHHLPLAVSPSEVGERAERPFTPEHFEEAWKRAREILPALHDTEEFTRTINGMFAFSVDGMPLIGETGMAGVWMAVGAWITHAGGVGKAVAELITEGETEWDLREASIDRFHAHQLTGEYIRVVTEKNYREVYYIRHPQEPPTAPRGVRLSPFAPRLASLGPHNLPFGGIELAAWYDANEVLTGRYPELPARSEWASLHWSAIAGAEHLACRDSAALFDLTGLSIIEVRGGRAVDFVNYLCSSQMNVTPGRVVYTLWLTAGGGVKRDLAVARLGPDRFWMFVGEGTRPQDVAWARRHASAFSQVTLTDISDAYAALGLWGPDAPGLLEDLIGGTLDLGYFRGDWIELGPAPVYCMRLSYVGEAGFELHIPVDQALPVFDRLWESGKSRGLVMAGSTAMNSLRIEKGYRLWGADIHTEYDPYQAGLGWTVALDKEEDFLGSAPCRERADTNPDRRLACLVLDQGDPLGNEAVLYDGNPIGHVTSAAFGHSIGAAVAYAYLPRELAEPGTEVDVLVEGKPRRAVVSPEPLWDSEGTRLRQIHPRQ